MDPASVISALESILFISEGPVSIARLSEILSVDEKEVGKAIDRLHEEYEKNERGFLLIGKDESVLLSTKAQNAPFVERYLSIEREGPLSRAALETLSIIAYRGPVGRTDIEAIRGVNSTMTLKNLLLRGLIERKGNPDDARGYLYEPSFAFLESIGFSRVSELPEYDILSRDERLAGVIPDSIPKTV